MLINSNKRSDSRRLKKDSAFWRLKKKVSNKNLETNNIQRGKGKSA